jgi:hypothetical protein
VTGDEIANWVVGVTALGAYGLGVAAAVHELARGSRERHVRVAMYVGLVLLAGSALMIILLLIGVLD